MNNTDKLLRAFIEASGFEVKETRRACFPMDNDAVGPSFDGEYYAMECKVTKKYQKEKTDKEKLSELNNKKYDIEYAIGCLESKMRCDNEEN